MPTWIKRLLRRHHDEEASRPVTEGQRAANAALGRAQADRSSLRALRSEVRAEAAGWRARRERNHLAEQIRATVLGGEGR